MQGSVRKRGNKWYYCFDTSTVDGKRKRIERSGGDTKKEALQKLREAINKYEKTGNVNKNSSLSYSDYLKIWMNSYVTSNCKKTSFQGYERDIKNHIEPRLGTYKLKNLSPAILQDFLNSKSICGLSKNTISNFYGILSGSLKYAVYPLQYISENPMQYVKMPKFEDVVENYSNNKLKIITTQDYMKIIERFPLGSTFYMPVVISFNTGLRAGEVCALTWNDIDFENKTLTVNKTEIRLGSRYEIGSPKTKSSIRVIAIGNTLISALKRHKELQDENRIKYGEYYCNSNNICTKENGEPVNTGSFRYLSRVINYELHIAFNFHSLRHTHATMLIEAGANMKDVQKRLGHAKLSTTMDTYVSVTEKMRTDTVDILEGINSTLNNL